MAYASRGLGNKKRRKEIYSYFKLELLTLKWAVCKKFRGYLWGETFTVFSDNNPLRHLHSDKLEATEQRWFAELATYNFTVKYRPVKHNANADPLSGYPVHICQPRRSKTQWAAVTCLSPTTTVPELPLRTAVSVAGLKGLDVDSYTNIGPL